MVIVNKHIFFYKKEPGTIRQKRGFLVYSNELYSQVMAPSVHHMGRNARKPVFGISDKARLQSIPQLQRLAGKLKFCM